MTNKISNFLGNGVSQKTINADVDYLRIIKFFQTK